MTTNPTTTVNGAGPHPDADVQATLDAYLTRLRQAADTNIGFPAATDIDYTPLAPFLGFMLNNLGDPQMDGTYPMHTKSLEREVIDTIADLLRAPADDRWGYVTTGASEGTEYALYLARTVYPDAIVYHSQTAHHSIASVLHRLGMESVVIRADEHGELDYTDLADQLARHRAWPAVIVANAGTALTEAIDDTRRITAVLDDQAIRRRWCHVDAALAGIPLALLDPTDRPGVDLADGADSIVVSGHKWLGTPIPSAVVITRASRHTALARVATYTGSPDATITNSRSGLAALTWWYAWRTLGIEGMRQRADAARQVAIYAHQQLIRAGLDARRQPHAITVTIPTPPRPAPPRPRRSPPAGPWPNTDNTATSSASPASPTPTSTRSSPISSPANPPQHRLRRRPPVGGDASPHPPAYRSGPNEYDHALSGQPGHLHRRLARRGPLPAPGSCRGSDGLMTGRLLHPTTLPMRSCAYIDAEISPLAELGAAYLDQTAGLPAAGHGLVLRTCHRMEVYSPAHEAGFPEGFRRRALRLRDPVAIHRRLAEIAAGVRSLIVGESFVWHQVDAAAAVLPRRSVLVPAAREALDLARRLRAAHRLAAPLDYPQAALLLLEQQEPVVDGLIIVGGGMLARSVATLAAHRYREVLMVTRSPRRLRRRLDGGQTPEICRVHDAGSRLGAGAWHVVVATTQLANTYRAAVLDLVADERCRGVVDLCASPLQATGSPRYTHMYHQEFLQLIAKHNATVADRADAVRRDIAEYYEESR